METIKWIKLFYIAKETRELAKGIIPLIIDIPFDKVQLDGNNNLIYLTSKLSALIDGLIFSDNISFNEFAQNNYEFLDTLKTTLNQILSLSERQSIPIIEKDEIHLIQAKIDKLIIELNVPPFLQLHKRILSDENLHEDESDKDFTEPVLSIYVVD